MHVLATWKTIIVLVAALMLPLAAEPNDLEAVDGPNVRVMRHDDGSRSVFRRSQDNRTLTKRTYSGNGVLTLVTIYRMDTFGNLIGCKIYDGQKTELFKVSYGYHKETGQLVAEHMFDARVVRKGADGGEIPVRIVNYTYDALGNRSAPIVHTTQPGKLAEDVFGASPSAPEQNLFREDEGPRPANPNARPLRGR
jgi:hypothetical protein